MQSTRPHRPKPYKMSPNYMNYEANMVVQTPCSLSEKQSSSNNYYVKCVLAPHRAKRSANANRAGVVVCTSLCPLGSIIWLLSMAAATNVLDQGQDWLASSYYYYQREQTTTAVMDV